MYICILILHMFCRAPMRTRMMIYHGCKQDSPWCIFVFVNIFIINFYHVINFGHIFHRTRSLYILHDESYNVVEDTMEVGWHLGFAILSRFYFIFNLALFLLILKYSRNQSLSPTPSLHWAICSGGWSCIDCPIRHSFKPDCLYTTTHCRRKDRVHDC